MPGFCGAFVDRVAHNGGDVVVLDSQPFSSSGIKPADHQAGKTTKYQYVVYVAKVVASSDGKSHIIQPDEHAWYDSLPAADQDFRDRAEVLGHDLPPLTSPRHMTVYTTGTIPQGSVPARPPPPSPPAADDSDVDKTLEDLKDPATFLKSRPAPKKAAPPKSAKKK